MNKISPDNIEVIEDDSLSPDISSSLVYGSFGGLSYNIKKFLLSYSLGSLFVLFVSYIVFYSDFRDGESNLYLNLVFVGTHVGILIGILTYFIGFLSLRYSLMFSFTFYIIFVISIVFKVFYGSQAKYSRVIVFNRDEIIELNQRLDGGKYDIIHKSDISDIVVEKNIIEVKTSEEDYKFDINSFEDIYNNVYNFSD